MLHQLCSYFPGKSCLLHSKCGVSAPTAHHHLLCLWFLFSLTAGALQSRNKRVPAPGSRQMTDRYRQGNSVQGNRPSILPGSDSTCVAAVAVSWGESNPLFNCPAAPVAGKQPFSKHGPDPQRCLVLASCVSSSPGQGLSGRPAQGLSERGDREPPAPTESVLLL